MKDFDWNQARAFHATVEQGSLSAAARTLGLTQPTLSRQVAALESSLGVLLFERIGKTLVPTEAGLDLMDHVRAMGEAAGAMALAASGKADDVKGTVTVSASDGFAAYLLPPVLARMQNKAPQITIEVVVSNALSDLRRREADIAIRHVRSEQPDLIARLVRTSSVHLYASRSWVGRHGLPRAPADLATADFIGFDRNERFIKYLNGLDIPVTPDNFRILSENFVVVSELVRRGVGVSMMIKDIGDAMPDLVPLLPDLEPFPFPIWLVSHRELHTSRRIRRTFDMLVAELRRPAGD